ncbi:galectin-9-like [Contarinia nasturtii]|uniref:galectin-9-like n=1 Tax=Contarinia nasturtii TaxID=265458 RepID=UPI0012D3CB5F|nr:galectin-9-like [Contarinia nasturtii]XP_031625379.1 galectin-9-like [Contarinia nasturtii]
MGTVNNPEVPFLYSIPGSLHHGSKIEIAGQMLDSERFRVDLKTGSHVPDNVDDNTDDDVNFHLSVRPLYGISRNHMTEDGWGEEEHDDECPIAHGAEFKMVILVEEDKFKVVINDLDFCDFQHRMPLSLAKFLYINGEVKIHYIKIENVA